MAVAQFYFMKCNLIFCIYLQSLNESLASILFGGGGLLSLSLLRLRGAAALAINMWPCHGYMSYAFGGFWTIACIIYKGEIKWLCVRLPGTAVEILQCQAQVVL